MEQSMRMRFNPTKDGLVKVLGPLETDIMQLIWQDRRSTVKKVHRKLSQQREIAYTTVMTTMSRLADKGLLSRERDGLAYVYSPTKTEQEFISEMVQQVLDGLMDDYSELTMEYMVNYLVRHRPADLGRLHQRVVQADQTLQCGCTGSTPAAVAS